MIKKGNIIIVCGTLESGGAERVISILSSPFADSFDKVTIITWRHAPQFYKIDSRVSIISLPILAESNNNLIKIKYFRRYIKTHRPDLVLSFLTLFNIYSLLSLIGINIPVIAAERNDPRHVKGGFPIKLIQKILYNKASGILCQTKSISNYFKSNLHSKTHIIYNPITLSEEYIGKGTNTEKKKRIVSVGRLHPQKNQQLLIDAFKLFHEKHPDYTLTIYGKGPLREYLQQYINNLGLSNFIELAGEQDNIKDLILDAKAFVMTSSFEGMPNALIEAMCLGLPCISTKVSGAVDLIEDRVNGILVDSEATSIASKMDFLAKDNPETFRLGQNASKIYQQLNTTRISKDWIDYLKSKIKRNSPIINL